MVLSVWTWSFLCACAAAWLSEHPRTPSARVSSKTHQGPDFSHLFSVTTRNTFIDKQFLIRAITASSKFPLADAARFCPWDLATLSWSTTILTAQLGARESPSSFALYSIVIPVPAYLPFRRAAEIIPSYTDFANISRAYPLLEIWIYFVRSISPFCFNWQFMYFVLPSLLSSNVNGQNTFVVIL